MAGVDFVDGQVSGEGSGAPFAGGSMSNGGPIEGPCGEYDKSTTVNVSGEMPPTGSNPVESPVDNV